MFEWKKVMKKLILFGLLVASIGAFGQGDTLSLEEALRIGLENNFSIRLANQDIALANNNVTLGNAGFLPVVDASLARSNSVQGVNQEFITGDVAERNGAKSNSWNAGAQLSWTVFDGLAMFTTYDKLKELQALGETEAAIVVRDAMAQISATYYELVQQHQVLEVLQENLLLSSARVSLSRERFEIGSASRREWLLAQVDVNADSSALLQQEGLQARTHIRLNQLLGRDPATDFLVAQEIDLRPRFSFEPLKTQMLAQNPAVLQARQRREIALLELREMQAERLPAVDLNLGYNFTRANSEAGFLLSNQIAGVNYGFSAGINLFNGFNLGRRIQNVRVQIETTAIEAEALQQSLETALLDAWLNYDNNYRLLSLERANVAVSRQNLDIARQTYELGELSSIEFREAQTNHIAAENRLITALYRIKINEIELMRLSGSNLD